MNTDKLNGYGMVFQASEPTEKENGIKLEESVDTVFDKISEIQKRITAKKIANMEDALKKLETELTEIISLHVNRFSEDRENTD